MIRRKALFKKGLSFLVTAVMLVSSVIPSLSFVTSAEDEPIVTETASQTINEFSISFARGAENKGTVEEPDYVWTASNSGSAGTFVFQLNYDLSGQNEIGVGKMQFVVPKHIIKNRDGAYADDFEVAVPEREEVPETDKENDFVYVERANDILIYNRIELTAAQLGSIQFSYKMNQNPVRYEDLSVTDAFTAQLNIDKSEGEHLHTVGVAPTVKIDTWATIRSTTKTYSSRYDSWQSSWGNAQSFGITDPDDYYYLTWNVRTDIGATQPYVLTLRDTVTGDYGESEFVAVKFSGGSYSASTSSEPIYSGSGYSYHNVLTKHKKSAYQDQDSYIVKNNVTAEVQPYDNKDSITTASSAAQYSYIRPRPTYPIGHFNFWKYNHYGNHKSTPVNYQLGEFVDGDISEIEKNIDYMLDMVAYAYPWTIGNGYSTEDIDHYGENPVTYVMTDDEFYFRDFVTASNVPNGTQRLDSNDFEITKVRYTLNINGAKWDPDSLSFVTAPAKYTDENDLHFFARFNDDEDWTEVGVYSLKDRSGRIIETNKVVELTGSNIVFADDSGCVGYKIVTTNSFYYTGLTSYPSCKIKHSNRIDGLIAEAYNNGEKRAWLTNRANVRICQASSENISDDNMIFSKTEVARDYFIGYEKQSYINKQTTFQSNNKVKKTVTVGWSVEMYENYMTDDGLVYVPQDGGVFYDLLPAGCSADLSTVQVTDGVKSSGSGSILRESQYDVSTITNYKNTGRTMLIVSVKKSSDSGYRLTYSTVQSWESLYDFGNSVRNSVAFETGNSSIAGGYPDSGGNITDASLMRELDNTTDDKRFIYAERSCNVTILVAVNSGLYKRVKASGDSTYLKHTLVHQDQSYEYYIRYANDFKTKSKNVVLFDNIESYENAQEHIVSQWQGTLQSVDVSQLRSIGADPVIYLSETKVDISQQAGIDLSGSSVWKRQDVFGDLSKAKAIAVDISKAQDGSDFVLEKSKSVAVILNMKAPSAEPDGELPEGQKAYIAYNDVSAHARLVSIVSADAYEDKLVEWAKDSLELRIVGDVPLLKLDENDRTKPVGGISFRLLGTSDYGTDVNIILETDADGRVTFRNVEKGTYQLSEYIGSSDYQRIENTFTVVISSDGSTTIDGQELSDRYEIYDKPRIHADIEFNKRDFQHKTFPVAGAKFRLYGTSGYGNSINLYAVSEANGKVIFNDVELGSYTLIEVEAAEGYLKNGTEYPVRVDENGNFAIDGAVMEKDGTLTVYNTPLQSFTIQKEGYVQVGGAGVPLKDAVFHLYGTSNLGTEVDQTKTTLTNGQATFKGLEEGSYILEETAAPENYNLDPTPRVVTITADGVVTISGTERNDNGYFVIRDKEDGNITVTKKWIDNETNNTRTARPVIHVGIEDSPSVAYFSGNGGSTILNTVTLPYNTTPYRIKSFAPYTGGDEAYVQDLINSGTAKRIDNYRTNYSIYAWYESGTGAVYWWSDAATVYLTDASRHLWHGLTDCVSIDVSGINTSLVTNMSMLFSGCYQVKTIDVSGWDTSNVTDMSSMFSSCYGLTNLDVSGWDTSNVTDMTYMFNKCSKLTGLDLSGFDTSSVTNMQHMFDGCSQLTSLELNSWITSNVTDMTDMFIDCNKLENLEVSDWDVSNVTNMYQMFYNCSRLTSLDVSGWDVSNVTNMYQMFYNCSQLTSLDVSGWVPSSVTTMASMFRECTSLTSLDLSGWDVSNVTNMYQMFYSCSQLTSLDVSGWDTSSVTNMHSMFCNCSQLTSLDLSSFNTFIVTVMTSMFYNCSKLVRIYASVLWNTNSVTYSAGMFNNCFSLNKDYAATRYNSNYIDKTYARIYSASTPGYLIGKDAPPGSQNTGNEVFFKSNGNDSPLLLVARSSYDIKKFQYYNGNVGDIPETAIRLDDNSTDYQIYAWYDNGTVYWYSNAEKVYLRNNANKLWYNLPSVTYIDTSHIDISKLTDMSSMFSSCYGLTNLDVSGWDTSSVTDMNNMFNYCRSLTSLDVGGWDTSGVTRMGSMFYYCPQLTSLDVSTWNTSNVTGMSSMFSSCYGLTNLDVSGWDTSKVQYTQGMFRDCSQLSNLDVSGWDTSKVYYMNEMFFNCSQLTSLDLSGWDTSKVTRMENMFQGCSQLTSLDVSDWDTSNVQFMQNMFRGCSRLTNLDVGIWDTSSVTTMELMFYGCSNLTSLDLSGWVTHNVTSISSMFNGCSNLITIYASRDFDISKINNFGYSSVFSGCTALVGQNGTTYDVSKTSVAYAVLDTDATPGYLTYKKYVDRVKTLYTSDDVNSCTLEMQTDDTWTYTFSGLDPDLEYYIWEEELQNYKSANMGEKHALHMENGNAVITNTTTVAPPKFGDLKLTKYMLNKNGSSNITDNDRLQEFLFTITLTDADDAPLTGNLLLEADFSGNGSSETKSILFVSGVTSLRLSPDESVIIHDIPEGYKYTVSEAQNEDYTISYSNESGTIVADTLTSSSVTNTKKFDDNETVPIKLKKRVTGNVIEANEEFEFTLDLENLLPGTVYAVTSNFSNRSKIFTSDDNKSAFVRVSLRNSEEITLELPVNAKYCITEEAGKYLSSYQITDANQKESIIKTADYNTEENKSLSTSMEVADRDEAVTVEFTNHKNICQTLTLQKLLENAADDNADRFGFTLLITGLSEGAKLSSTYGILTDNHDGIINVDFSLADGDKLTVYEIPVGASYEIIEASSDYVSSYKIFNGTTVKAEDENTVPKADLSTGSRAIEKDVDPNVVFTNRKVSCDITITKLVDMTYGVVPKSEYAVHEFEFNVQLTGLDGNNKKYKDIVVEYLDKDTTGAIVTNLAEVMGMDASAAEAQAENATFSIKLHHGESFKIRSLPYGATCLVTESADGDYISSYTVKANTGSVLQTEDRANTVKNMSLSLNEAEKVNTTDTDIEFVFTNKYEFKPYVLPAAGTNDQRMIYNLLFIGAVISAAVYLFVNRKKKTADK